MAHLITESDRMVYAGAKPWHNEGKQIPAGLTAQQTLNLSGLDWTVHTSPVTYTDAFGVPCSAEGLNVLSRSDNGESLGVVSDKYTPINNQAVVDFITDVTGGRDIIETAGSFSGGRKVWFLLNQGTQEVAGCDPMINYLLFSTSHDGTAAFSTRATPVRVVCANTYSAALNQTAASCSIKHRGAMADHVEAKRKLLAADQAFNAFMIRANQLASMDTSTDWIEEYFKAAYMDVIAAPSARKTLITLGQDDNAAEYQRACDKRDRTLSTLRGNFEDADEGRTASIIRSSRWAAVNAVTRYLEHDAPMRGGSRLESNLIGSKAAQKDKVMGLALLG